MSITLKSRIRLYATLASIAAFVGCGANAKYDANVQGAVTIDGELAPGGSVTFTPVEKGPTGVGTIASDGSYSLRIGQGDVSSPDSSEIPAGEYVVTAMITGPSPKDSAPEGSPPPSGPKLIADKYGSRETSDLKFEVKKGPNIIVLKLDGPWANPPAEEASEKDATPTADEGVDDTAKPASADDAAEAAAEADAKVETTEPVGATPAEEAKP